MNAHPTTVFLYSATTVKSGYARLSDTVGPRGVNMSLKTLRPSRPKSGHTCFVCTGYNVGIQLCGRRIRSVVGVGRQTVFEKHHPHTK
jgi:hypothetical protein